MMDLIEREQVAKAIQISMGVSACISIFAEFSGLHEYFGTLHYVAGALIATVITLVSVCFPKGATGGLNMPPPLAYRDLR